MTRSNHLSRFMAQRWSRQRREAKRPHWRHFCWYCGIRTVLPLPDGRHNSDGRTTDHVQPTSRGGGNRMNTVDCCARCNGAKGDMTLHEFRKVCGGGLFWGELFAPHDIEWSDHRPPGAGEFRRWWDRQKTVGKDDWMDLAPAAEAARGPRPTPNAIRHARVRPPITRVVWTRSCPCWWCRLVGLLKSWGRP